MKLLWNRFCHETPMHGFNELFYAKSICAKIVWASIVLVGTVMTTLQIYIVLNNFCNNPSKTEISVLPSSITRKLPPYIYCLNFFTDWINMSKVWDYGFDYETFLYTMSHFNTIYTKYPIDVAEANRKMIRIMKDNNFVNIYDFGISMALRVPSNLLSNDTLGIFFNNEFQELCYIHNFTHALNESLNKKLTNYRLDTETFTDFEISKVNVEIIKIFNQSFMEEYEYYNIHYMWLYEFNVNLKSIRYPFPIYINVAGEKLTFYEAYTLSNNFAFNLKGTLYKWMSNNDRSCSADKEPLFYSDCFFQCSYKYKVMTMKTCELYLVSEDFEFAQYQVDKENACFKLVNKKVENAEDLFKSCIEDCTSSCVQWKYDFTVSHYANDFLENSTTIKGGIEIFFDEADNMLMISLLPSATWDQALASVGGLLGLWLGGSIISFSHVLYIFCCIPLQSWLIKRTNKFSNKFKLFFRQSKIVVANNNNNNNHTADSGSDKKGESSSQTYQNDLAAVREDIRTSINNMKVVVQKYNGELKEPLLGIVDVLDNLFNHPKIINKA